MDVETEMKDLGMDWFEGQNALVSRLLVGQPGPGSVWNINILFAQALLVGFFFTWLSRFRALSIIYPSYALILDVKGFQLSFRNSHLYIYMY